MALLDSDLFDICHSCTEGTLRAEQVRWKQGKVACGVVCAQAGYPDQPPQLGLPIRGLDRVPRLGYGAGLQVLHASAQLIDELNPEAGVVACGGRVLTVMAVAETLQEARRVAYEGVHTVYFEGIRYRSDIGRRHVITYTHKRTLENCSPILTLVMFFPYVEH
jgi:phosphoribosylamine--glycine ligase